MITNKEVLETFKTDCLVNLHSVIDSLSHSKELTKEQAKQLRKTRITFNYEKEIIDL